VINGLNARELVALNSTLLHELYFASMGGDGQATEAMSAVLARDFGSVLRWKDEFVAMGNALAGGSGWVVLTYIRATAGSSISTPPSTARPWRAAFRSWPSTCTSMPTT
jgi:superoxide dismutase